MMVSEGDSADNNKPAGEAGDSESAAGGAISLVNFSVADRQLLRQRADRLAREGNGIQHSGETEQAYVCFRLGAVERYGIPYVYTEEIIPVSDIAPVPCTPPFIAGVTNRRGELLTVLDIKEFFHTDKTELGDESRIVVVSGNGVTIGILVDEMIGNDGYRPMELSKPLPSDGISKPAYIQGIHRGQVTILDMGPLLRDESIMVNESVSY